MQPGGIAPDDSVRDLYYPLRYVCGGPFLDIVIAETPIQSPRDALTDSTFAASRCGIRRLNGRSHRASRACPSYSWSVVFEEQAFGVAHPIFADSGDLDGMLVVPGLEFLLTADLGTSITSHVSWAIDNRTGVGDITEWPTWNRGLNLPGSTWTLTVQPLIRRCGPLAPATSGWRLPWV